MYVNLDSGYATRNLFGAFSEAPGAEVVATSAGQAETYEIQWEIDGLA